MWPLRVISVAHGPSSLMQQLGCRDKFPATVAAINAPQQNSMIIISELESWLRKGERAINIGFKLFIPDIYWSTGTFYPWNKILKKEGPKWYLKETISTGGGGLTGKMESSACDPKFLNTLCVAIRSIKRVPFVAIVCQGYCFSTPYTECVEPICLFSGKSVSSLISR